MHSVFIHKTTFKMFDKKLYTFYKNSPEKLPEFYIKRLEVDDKDTVLCDYISGMSDMYAVKTFSEHFIPKNWKL